jgi:hypothetical protein
MNPFRFLTTATFLFLALTTVSLGADIPDRPEKLKYPELQFTPPNPTDYRVALKSGPVAYVVPDHELPWIRKARKVWPVSRVI